MDLTLLQVLDAVLTQGSVTRAARVLGKSQPAVSNALRRLRERLGDPLVVRTPTGMVPTEYARHLAPALRVALHDLGQILAHGQRFVPAEAQRTFTLATTDYVGSVLLPSLMARLRREAPRVDLRLRAWPRGRAGLATGEVDFILARRDQVTESSRAVSLFEDELVGLARRDHPQVKKRPSLATYLSLDHVLVSPRGDAAPGVVDTALAAEGLTRRVALRVPHVLLVPAVVASTDLVAALSERVAEPFTHSLPLRTFPLPLLLPSTRVSLLWHERTHASAAHRWFRRLVREVARAATAGARAAPGAG